MFTGIIQGIGEVQCIKKENNGYKHFVKLPSKLIKGLIKGASISYNGCCLTVVNIENNLVVFNIINATFNSTNLKKITLKEKVNIERALKLNDEIGGHLMSGHIMTTAKIFKIVEEKNNYSIYLKLSNPDCTKFILHKGFIGIDGVSLTVNNVFRNTFSVSLIPITLSMTTLKFKTIGELVNIEIDSQTQTIVETIERLKKNKKTNINKDFFFNRKKHFKKTLHREELFKNPMDLFSLWLKEAIEAKLPNPNAMCVATVDKYDQPYQRMVLLKDFNKKNMTFYTNFKSKKGCHLEKNSNISLLFHWHILERQVIVIGKAKKTSLKKTEKYFYSRPKNNQISSYISPQSKFITSRKILEKKFFEYQKKFYKKLVPLPRFWGGYTIKINIIEFWQGGKYRLHDRFSYHKNKKNWIIHRLAP